MELQRSDNTSTTESVLMGPAQNYERYKNQNNNKCKVAPFKLKYLCFGDIVSKSMHSQLQVLTSRHHQSKVQSVTSRNQLNTRYPIYPAGPDLG